MKNNNLPLTWGILALVTFHVLSISVYFLMAGRPFLYAPCFLTLLAVVHWISSSFQRKSLVPLAHKLDEPDGVPRRGV